MTKPVVGAVVATMLAVTSPVAADTGQPENPGCFGKLASTGAQAGAVGEFARTNAQRYKGNDGESIGEIGIPFLRSLSCPGDYRGRPAERISPT